MAQLILSPEGDIALGLADFVRADEVRKSEVGLQVLVLFVVDVPMMIGAEMARVMLSTQMVVECHVIEEELLAEIAIGMWQYLAVLFVTNVSRFNVSTQRIHVVEPLFPNEDRSAL